MEAASPIDIGTAVSRLIAMQGTLIAIGTAVSSYVVPKWLAEMQRQGTAVAPRDSLEDAKMTREVARSYMLFFLMMLLMMGLLVIPVVELQVAVLGVLDQRTLLGMGCVVFAATGGAIVLVASIRR